MVKNGPIIIVDDDNDDQQIIKEALEQSGIDVKTKCFSNGKEALTFLTTTSEQPFIIICDINMPLMTGIELRQQIEANKALKEKSIPFIFFTTTANPQSVKEAYQLSVQGFFEKPTSIDAIKELLLQIYQYWQKCHHPNN